MKAHNMITAKQAHALSAIAPSLSDKMKRIEEVIKDAAHLGLFEVEVKEFPSAKICEAACELLRKKGYKASHNYDPSFKTRVVYIDWRTT